MAPHAWAQNLVARAQQPLAISVDWDNTKWNSSLDVFAARSTDGAQVVLRVVNLAQNTQNTTFIIKSCGHSSNHKANTVNVTEMWSSDIHAVNQPPPAAPSVKARPGYATLATRVEKNTTEVRYLLRPFSFSIYSKTDKI